MVYSWAPNGTALWNSSILQGSYLMNFPWIFCNLQDSKKSLTCGVYPIRPWWWSLEFTRKSNASSRPSRSKVAISVTADKTCCLTRPRCAESMIWRSFVDHGNIHHPTGECIAGWWFETWLLFSISYMGCHPSHWRTPSFFKMVIAPPTR